MWTETVSSQKICSDNRCKKSGPSAPTRAHKAANTPVVPPRPTERALKAKRSQPRKQYVELDLSNGSTTLQGRQTSYRTSHGNCSSSPVKPAQKPAGIKQQRATVGTSACATTAGSTGGVPESPLASSRLVQQPLKERSQDPCTGYPSNSLPRTAASHRSSVPQAASGNSLRRERMKVTVINVREPDYKTSRYTRTTQDHRKPPAPISARPTSTPSPQTGKKPDPPKRPEPPKSRLEERGPMPLPRSKNPPRIQVTQSLPSLTSKQEYEYVDTELRRVVYTSVGKNAVHSASLKLSKSAWCNFVCNRAIYDMWFPLSYIDCSGPGVYTALDQLTMDKRNGIVIISHICVCKHSFAQFNFLKSNNRKIVPFPCLEM